MNSDTLGTPDSENLEKLVRKFNLPSSIQTVFVNECNTEIQFVREDLIHPVISGNKWRKLKYHLHFFLNNDYSHIVSMGGCYSNHLHALAFVCDQLNIPCTLLIYGLNGESNSPTLKDCQQWNAELIPISRQEAVLYRQYSTATINWHHPSAYWIPEGGGGAMGALGMKDLVNDLPQDFDQPGHLLVCASGTGTSVQGLLNHTSQCSIATSQIVKMAVYPWMKNDRIKMIQSVAKNSFAKRTTEISDFIVDFKKANGISLDAIYTGPLLYFFIKENRWQNYKRIYFIHTGGLQANRVL